MSERKPQHLTTKRAGAGVPDIINAWFDQVQDVFTSAGLHSSKYITVHCAGSASGEQLPQFILYKVKTCTKGGRRVAQQVRSMG